MKRMSKRIQMAKKSALKRAPSTDQIEKRAKSQARNQMTRRWTRGKNESVHVSIVLNWRKDVEKKSTNKESSDRINKKDVATGPQDRTETAGHQKKDRLMIHSFKNYLIEEDKIAYFTFGRLNPPTIGHEKLMDALAKQAGSNDYFVFVSQTQDKKKNPLNYNAKVKHIRKMFPRHARRVMINKKVRTVFDAASLSCMTRDTAVSLWL